MELCGELVNHKTFGKGQIVEFDNNYVTVLFENSKEEKKFKYPHAFDSFLEIENKSFLEQIEEDKNVLDQEEAEMKRINEEKAMALTAAKTKEVRTRNAKSTAAKSSNKTSIAFKCNYCDGGKSNEVVGFKGVCSDEIIKYNIKTAKHIWCSQPENMCYKYLNGEISREEICGFYEEKKSEFSKCVCYESQMLEIWNAGAGITQNGDEKGKPMSLRNVKANSLAMLTTKLPYADDKERFIFAVFLIDENYEGDNREEGYVSANPKYRIQLSLDEAKNLKFWDYYYNENNPELIKFGSGLHRYFSDVQAAQVLKKIYEIKKSSSEELFSKEFLDYYCKIKQIDIESISVANGALQRKIG